MLEGDKGRKCKEKTELFNSVLLHQEFSLIRKERKALKPQITKRLG